MQKSNGSTTADVSKETLICGNPFVRLVDGDGRRRTLLVVFWRLVVVVFVAGSGCCSTVWTKIRSEETN